MSTRHDRWVLARHRIRDDAAGVVLIWAGFLLAVLALEFSVSMVRSIEISGWGVATQLARWFAGAMGVYTTAFYLPLYIAHGYTRREIFRQMLPAGAITALLLAALTVVGFGIERMVYGWAGWPQVLSQEHLFTTPTDYPLIFVEFLVIFAVWVSAGALGGAGFYRHPVSGVLIVPVVAVMVGVAEGLTNPGFLAGVTSLLGLAGGEGSPTVVGAGAVCAVAVGLSLALTWLLVRDVPVRPQNT